ncbi:MAG: hypothetical protein EOM92_19200 [Gammaproteobacteria bacterium]|nr:hypothetical protein [Gammaproteobacteria bacterium]
MQIILASLDNDDPEQTILPIDRDQFTTAQLTYNLNHLWAWNLRGWPGFEADGPAIFVTF